MININNNKFFIKSNEIVEGFKFEAPLYKVTKLAGIPFSDEYIVNWHFDDEDIMIENIKINDTEVWTDADDKEWTDDDDNLFEALSHYITNNIL